MDIILNLLLVVRIQADIVGNLELYLKFIVKIQKWRYYMRVRVCIKCREYIYLHHCNLSSQKTLKRFEAQHYGHTMATINESELMDIRANEKPFKKIKRASV